MKNFVKIFSAIFILIIPINAFAVLKIKSWTRTLISAGVPQTIYNAAEYPEIRYVPAFRIFNNNPAAGSNKVYPNDVTASSSNSEPVYPQLGISYSNEQTTGQVAKPFDLQQIFFDADADGAEVIITVIYDDELY